MPWVPDADEIRALLRQELAEVRRALHEELVPVTTDLRRLEEQFTSEEESFLDSEEAARALGCSARTLRRRIEQQEIRAVRGGRGWRIPRSALK